MSNSEREKEIKMRKIFANKYNNVNSHLQKRKKRARATSSVQGRDNSITQQNVPSLECANGRKKSRNSLKSHFWFAHCFITQLLNMS